ncbi:hypothetical protein [Burkholderia metallica]|uniref:hypothetical protein n=1 Tax=Burkholderia metallica TaxID=488729 RepID=UPI00158E42A3|nr:hypothetical protein [Burkholderia metallica]
MFLIWFLTLATHGPMALALGEKIRVFRQRLSRMPGRSARADGISGAPVVAGEAWSGFVIADLARGYCANVERDGAVLLRNAIGEGVSHAR